MKIIITILFLIISATVFSQSTFAPVVPMGSPSTFNRATGAVGSLTGIVWAKTYDDTTAANNSSFVRYTPGIVILVGGTSLYVRNQTISAWVLISGGGGGSGFTSASNGLSTSSSTNVVLGGSALAQYSPVTVGSFPLTIIHNGIDSSSQSDSNMLRFLNNTAATSISSAMTTPGIRFSTNSWKTIGGAASQPVGLQLDFVGTGGSTIGAGLFRWISTRNTTRQTIFSMTTTGVIPDPLNLNGARIGYSTSAFNEFFGASALLANTSGSNNTAIGRSALQLNTTGIDNTALGDLALASNITGNYNTAIGSQALQFNDTIYNTAVGYAAMEFNTKGYANTAVGVNAMTNNVTGIKNTAVGAGSLENTLNGFNSGLGEDVLLRNLNGHDNIGIGWLGMSGNYNGHYNIGIGNSTGRTLTTGNYNIMIGHEAGYLNSQDTAVNHVILLGANTYSPVSNRMVLGDTTLTSTFIRGIATSGSTSDRVVVQNSAGQMLSIAQSSIVGATPTWQAVTDVGATTTNKIGFSRSEDTVWYYRNTAYSNGRSVALIGRADNGATIEFYNDANAVGASLSLAGGLYAGGATLVSLTNNTSQNRLIGQVSSTGVTGYTTVDYGLLLTSGSLKLDTTIAVNKAGAQVIAGIKNFTNGLNANTSITTGSTTFSFANTTATTVTEYGAATSFTLGGTPTTAATFNIGTNATATATTKTLNFGTGGASGSTTAINIGSATSGATNNVKINITPASDAAYDLYYRGSGGLLTRLANGTTGQVLTATTSNAPSWASAGGAFWPLTGSASLTGTVNLNIGANQFIATSSGDNYFSMSTSEVFIGLGGSVIDQTFSSAGIKFRGNLDPDASNIITSGTYTPTVTNEVNCGSTSISVCQYLRVGNTVTVSGIASVDPVLTATTTSFDIDLPITSNFSNDAQGGGVAFCARVAAYGAAIRAIDATSTIRFEWKSADITGQDLSFSFTYQILP